MKRRIIALALCLCICLSVGMSAVGAAETETSGTCGENLTWSFDAESGTLKISGSGAMNDFGRYFGNGKLLAPWEELKPKILHAELPNGLLTVGDWAFCGCENLVSVNLPAGLKSIGESAFPGTALTAIDVPDSVETIKGHAFSGCGELTDISLPDTIRELGAMAFQDCGLYKEQLKGDGRAVYIDRYLVNANVRVTPLDADESWYTFYIEEGTVGIGSISFELSQIRTVYVPSSMRMLSPRALDGRSIQNVYFAEGIEEIGSYAFAGAMSLDHVELPASVKKIGTQAFATADGGSLDELCFFGDAPELAERAFEGVGGRPAVRSVYFMAGRSGWRFSTWNGINARWWDGKKTVKTEFADVPRVWYREPVYYAVGTGLMNGVGNELFEPESSMTRAMLVTVLWRFAGSPKEGTNTFTDVPNGKWYTDAVAWAAAKGVVGGVGNGRFDPNGNVTREQMAAILFRYADATSVNTEKRGDFAAFADADKAGKWAKDALSWAVAENIIGGSKENGKLFLDPKGNATRAQVAAILMRFIENVIR